MNCPFCGNVSTTSHWRTRDQENAEYCVDRCSACHTLFLSPAPNDEELARAYATNYYGGTSGAKFGRWLEALRDRFALARARCLSRHLGTAAKILDIGCGDGRFLRSCHGVNASFELHGIELPGRAAKRAATVPSISLHLGTLETVDLPDGYFDLISLAHVFEHLPKPHQAVEKIARLLKPGGRLFISYPNGESWQAALFRGDWFHLDPPRHLSLVPPDALTRRLSELGFTTLRTSHLCWEQNTFGWLQSLLNKVPGKRNLLYESMKKNRPYIKGQLILLSAHAIAAIPLLPLAALLDLTAACFRSGATVEQTFQKST